MCGINLIIEKGQGRGKDAIAAMTRKTAYRGPDFQQIVSLELGDYQVHLGFDRLSLLDLSIEAHQPFFSLDRRYVLLFNGEIYNYQTLKKQLQAKGIEFKTHSDTEVLLQWLICFGTENLGQINGMFAFVWIDLEAKEVWLSRDSVGMKPLFMSEVDETIIVSSVIDGLLASGLVKKNLNRKAIQQYIQFRSAKAPDTFFEDIREVVPGSLLCWRNGVWKKKGIESTQKTTFGKDLEETLSQAVLSHLQADVQGGIFLSGGVDSTLLLAILQSQNIKLPAFSIHTGQEEDAFYARLAAKQYGSELQEVQFGKQELEGWSDFVKQIDQPIADTAAWLTYTLSAQAKKQVKFVLSGAGADELFAGYHRHQAFHWYLNNPRNVELIIQFKPVLLSASRLAGTEKKRLIGRLLNALDNEPSISFLNFISLRINHNQAQAIVKTPEDWFDWALRHDQEHYLVGDVLAVSDRMSMQHGLEMRMPYLDQEVIKLARGISAQDLLKHGRKTPLVHLLNRLGGKAFTTRSKYGFGLPMAQWIREGRLDEMLKILQDQDHIVFQFVTWQRTQELLKAHRQGKDDYSAEIYAIALLAHWLSLNT